MSFSYDAIGSLLQCPVSRADLVLVADRLVNCDPQTRLAYPIVDGLPILLADEALPLAETEWATIMRNQQRDPETGHLLASMPAEGSP